MSHATPRLDPSTVQGFQEVVISVRDLDLAINFYTHAAAFQVIAKGPADPSLLAAYQTPGAHIDEAVLAPAGATRGLVRLVQFSGVPQQIMRSSGRAFDTGGFFDINVRVNDIEQSFSHLQDQGCPGYSDPLQYGFGPLVVKEVLAQCHDGVIWALIQRISPPLTGIAPFEKWNAPHNATMVVADYAAHRKFLVEGMGLTPTMEVASGSPESGENILGLPLNMASKIPRKVGIFKSGDDAIGTVEILSFDGAKGADFSSKTKAPNRGILAVRYPVADVDLHLQRLAKNGIQAQLPAMDAVIAPYGKVRIGRVVAPEGAWIEFISPRP